MAIFKKLLCDTCVKFGRPRKFIKPNSIDEVIMRTTGMCCLCFEEANPEMEKVEEERLKGLQSSSKIVD